MTKTEQLQLALVEHTLFHRCSDLSFLQLQAYANKYNARSHLWVFPFAGPQPPPGQPRTRKHGLRFLLSPRLLAIAVRRAYDARHPNTDPYDDPESEWGAEYELPPD